MIYNIDVKSVEWCTYLQLSQDKIGIAEWNAVLQDSKKNDIHKANQEAFSLPSRLISKVFLFRWIYRGSAFAYAHDPDFTPVSTSVQFWQDVIERYYSKYQGIYNTHMLYIKQATQTGVIISPFGREHKFTPRQTYEGLVYNESDITNHPNQGLGADVVAFARVVAFQRMKKEKIESKIISTVHDSIVLDGPSNELEVVAYLFDKIFRDLPKLITNYFNVKWTVPLRAEVKYGPNMTNLEELVLDLA